MVTIRVSDYAHEAYSNKDGDALYLVIKEHIDDDDPIVLSFEGMTSISSSFLNSSLVRVKKEYGITKIKTQFKFIKTTPSINSTIRFRFNAS